MRLVTVEQMVALEKEANSKGLNYAQMIENAGNGLANLLISKYGAVQKKIVLGLVGSGNNGSDTLVALTKLVELGWNACAYIVKSRSEDDPLLDKFAAKGGKVIPENQDQDFISLKEQISVSSVLLDGVLGTGVKLPLTGRVAQILSIVSNLQTLPVVVAVDCPSGIDCTTGEVAPECISANVTVCMAVIKRGLLQFPAFNYVGELVVIDINLPESLKAWGKHRDAVMNEKMASEILPSRPLNAHKGTFGTALIIAGSINYTGAVLLAGKAAYRSGVGLVRLGVPAPLHSALSGHLLEATWLILPHTDGVINPDAVDVVYSNLEKPTALLIGPGWGTEEVTEKFLGNLIAKRNKTASRPSLGFVAGKQEKQKEKVELPSMVIDADAIKLLAHIPDWHKLLPQKTVLTPHPGEMSVLCREKIEIIQADRIEIARKFATQWGHVLVLKGALTVIASPEGHAWVVPIATTALSHAGSGDVLAGMITSFIAQGMDAFHAAALGAWMHARAGLVAAEKIGSTASVLASDVIEAIPQVFASMHS